MRVTETNQDASAPNKPPERDPAAVALGDRVRQLRTAAGMTQQQLSVRLADAGYPLHPSAVAKTEAADRPVPVGEMLALASIFGVTLENLVTKPKGTDFALARVTLRGATAAVRDLEISEQEAETRLLAIRNELAAARQRLADAQDNMAAVSPPPPPPVRKVN